MKIYTYNSKDILRFYQKCGPPTSDGCRLWKGAKDDRGYGKFLLGNSCISAHKFAYLISKNIHQTQQRVVHSCSNPDCVAPAHLSERTNKGRPKSIDIALLKSHRESGLTQKEIAAKLECSLSSVKRLWNSI